MKVLQHNELIIIIIISNDHGSLMLQNMHWFLFYHVSSNAKICLASIKIAGRVISIKS